MSDKEEKRVPWLLWPFYALWRLVTLILKITGRVLCAILGLALMAAGLAVTLSIVGAPIGIPLAAFGFLLLVRALFSCPSTSRNDSWRWTSNHIEGASR